MIRAFVAATIALAVLCEPSSAEKIAVVGKIWTGTDAGTIDDGVIIIEDGKILALGADLEVPEDADQIIGGPNAWVTPGIIAPFSRVGIVEVGAESSTDDRAGGNKFFSASLRAVDGFNPSATSIDVTRIEGVTHVVVAPTLGHSIIAGLGFIANTTGAPESIADDAAFMFVEMGEHGAQRAGGSRSASWAYLRGALAEGRERQIGRYRETTANVVSAEDALALVQVLNGRTKLMICAHRASDVRNVIRLSEQYRNMDIVMVGGGEAWLAADELAAADIPVIIDPFDNLPSSFESLAATRQNAKRLINAGVKTAFAHLSDDGHQARLVLQVAGNAVANGVSHDDALASITTTPAEIFGLQNLGKIARGAEAHVVVWNGDPLQITTSPEAVVINGEIQSMESRQTKLRNRYLTLEKDDKPFSYRKPN